MESTLINNSGIYKIQSNIKPERFYIGSAYNLKERKRTHLKRLRYNKENKTTKGASPKLQAHFNKYGEDDLLFIIIEQFEFINKEHLLSREQYYLDTLNPWFNICKVAGSSLGVKHLNTKYVPWNTGLTKETNESLRRESEKRKGKKASLDTKEKQSKNTAFRRSEVIAIITAKRIGKPHPSKNRRKKGEWHPTEETKNKMSIAKKNKSWEEIYSKEGLERLKEGRRNRKLKVKIK
jgi:group I intron endonuclease